jgi:hypothetical protein
VLREYVAYYNTHRPHRSLEQQPPLVETVPVAAHDHEWHVQRRDRLGGLLHEYELAAQRYPRDSDQRRVGCAGSLRLNLLRTVARRLDPIRSA